MSRLLILFVSLMIAATSWAQSEITVSANADVSAEPDIADFHVSIIVRQQQATEAFKVYLNRYDALQKSLQSLIDVKKLMTDNLSVTPSYDYKKPEQITPAYYQVSASMSLSIPISELNAVLGKIATVDGVTINGIVFRAKNQGQLEIQALEEAVQKAREKAEAITKLEGLTDLKVKSMNTSFSRPPIFPLYRVAAMEGAGPSVNPSNISVSASITVTYTAYSPKDPAEK